MTKPSLSSSNKKKIYNILFVDDDQACHDVISLILHDPCYKVGTIVLHYLSRCQPIPCGQFINTFWSQFMDFQHFSKAVLFYYNELILKCIEMKPVFDSLIGR